MFIFSFTFPQIRPLNILIIHSYVGFVLYLTDTTYTILHTDKLTLENISNLTLDKNTLAIAFWRAAWFFLIVLKLRMQERKRYLSV